MSVLLKSKTYCKLDVLYSLRKLHECCPKFSSCKLNAFGISVLWESKRYCKLDKIYALKSLDELDESKTYCKVDVMFALKSLQ